jgi:alkanesulfonate monooxygenase SsuD/methylene tetrahydromethanopterin reductase-like flavin-dependent oxidoreductase (luciferase family)
MRRHAESVGRDPAEIGVALKAPLYDSTLDSGGARRRFSGTPEQIVEDVQLYERMGVTDLVFDTRDPDVNRSLERLSWLREEIVAKV